jgi:hypothetical protein
MIEEKLKNTIMILYTYTAEQVDKLDVGKLMTLVEYKDMDLYNEFKLSLRKDGWVI